jgi:hypothetical protein
MFTPAWLPDHEPARQFSNARFDGLAVDHGQQRQTRLASQRREVHIDRGRRRPGCLGDDFPIVESNHRCVVGHASPALAQGVDGVASDLVVAAKDCVGSAAQEAEDAADRLVGQASVQAPIIGSKAGRRASAITAR